ncbi:OVARIAN TUMOR DOMAIN-containing deubiquitinating enzyme 11-like [Tasmannia lanceolata]|uniref:OVARIAN TUMOR DOMAIN-containing deubiquitinating enzyme 11-like n=1 Tax=Tasmannia lanceolata TaxID=3420 RepID=UPI0040629678
MSEKYGNALATSISSLNSSVQDTDDHRTVANILLENFFGWDWRLRKHLSRLDPVPHIPRVTGQIPDVDDAAFDHEYLSKRLATYGLAELQVGGDGNCQFRALADQLFRDPDYHKLVRKQVVTQLTIGQKWYQAYVPMKYETYLQKMERSGEWGDHLTLQAAADLFHAKICLFTSFGDTSFIEIVPMNLKPSKELWLSFWSKVHYNSVYKSGDVPTRGTRRKFWLC